MVRLSELVDERLHHAHSANTAQLKIFTGLLPIFDSFHVLTVRHHPRAIHVSCCIPKESDPQSTCTCCIALLTAVNLSR